MSFIGNSIQKAKSNANAILVYALAYGYRVPSDENDMDSVGVFVVGALFMISLGVWLEI
jgi:hypothetical protein